VESTKLVYLGSSMLGVCCGDVAHVLAEISQQNTAMGSGEMASALAVRTSWSDGATAPVRTPPHALYCATLMVRVVKMSLAPSIPCWTAMIACSIPSSVE
jgi:hypothetical protein